MSRYVKALERLLNGMADQTIRFEEPSGLLNRLGFVERQRGSHRIASREAVL